MNNCSQSKSTELSSKGDEKPVGLLTYQSFSLGLFFINASIKEYVSSKSYLDTTSANLNITFIYNICNKLYTNSEHE